MAAGSGRFVPIYEQFSKFRKRVVTWVMRPINRKFPEVLRQGFSKDGAYQPEIVVYREECSLETKFHIQPQRSVFLG